MVQICDDPWIADDDSFRVLTPVVPTFEDMVIKEFYILGTRDWDVALLTRYIWSMITFGY